MSSVVKCEVPRNGPLVSNPLNNILNENLEWMTERISMGTTIIGCKYRSGIVLVADSRTSAGNVIAHRAARKLIPISDRIVVAKCGTASDSMNVLEIIRDYTMRQCVEMSHSLSQLPMAPVQTAVSIAKLLAYGNKDILNCGFIVGGWDPYKGPQIYSVQLGGTIIEEDFSCAGSGSRAIVGMADSMYRPDLTREEALEMLTKMVQHAMYRDQSSGGTVRRVVIDKEGCYEDFINGDELTVSPM